MQTIYQAQRAIFMEEMETASIEVLRELGSYYDLCSDEFRLEMLEMLLDLKDEEELNEQREKDWVNQGSQVDWDIF